MRGSIQRLLQLDAVTVPPSFSLDPLTPTLPPIPEVPRALVESPLPRNGRLIKPVTRLCFNIC